jgi:hypothetical protein
VEVEEEVEVDIEEADEISSASTSCE